ncbi:MAG: ribonuclease III [Lachnospiraceae bacterium]|nr:ribonuclease III [Lachnospiraceae bacterium]
MAKHLEASVLEERIGYHFNNKSLLDSALTHSSYANELKVNKVPDYERLEYLGDAVLELVSSDYIYHEHPSMPEGQMTRLRSSIVCEPALAYCSREFKLEEFIRLGKGEEATGGRNRDSIISDVCEAIIGAIYLDGGIEPAKKHILKYILSDLDNKQLFYDSKTILQEYIQRNSENRFEYVLIGETGPDHDKVFCVKAVLNGKTIGTGEGKTKKAAEQMAAYKALKEINIKRE